MLVVWGVIAVTDHGTCAEEKATADAAALARPQTKPTWRGVHLLLSGDRQVTALKEQLPKLAAVAVNTLILEVNYNFEFRSHPELSSPEAITPAHAHEVAAAARNAGIRLIPQLNCLGHQSWSRSTNALLTRYPQFDETPGQFPDNKGIYCRSWCPQNPDVNRVVFALIDELAEAFEADAFHAGMDEVFLIASEHCPRCKGGDPAKLFAKTVNDLHDHIVGQRKLQMLLWGDRLLDARAMHGGEWEYSRNGTSGAVDLIPKDIIICDWHYENQTNYPSVPFLLQKGFQVWPASWQPLAAAKAFSKFSREQKDPNLVGFLCTVWGKTTVGKVAEWPPVSEVLPEWNRAEPQSGPAAKSSTPTP
jgi:hypothetical protein